MNRNERSEWGMRDRDQGMQREPHRDDNNFAEFDNRGRWGGDWERWGEANRGGARDYQGQGGGGWERGGHWGRSGWDGGQGMYGQGGMSNQGGYGGRSAGWERGTGFGQGSVGGSYYDRGAGNYGATSPYGGTGSYGSADRFSGQSFDRDRGWGFGTQEHGYGTYGVGRSGMDESWQNRDYGRQDVGGYRGGSDDWRWNEQGRERTGGGMMEKVGRFFGIGPKGYKRSDARIQEDVSDMLMDHPEIDATHIEVKVQDGEVTLEGIVEERRIKRLAEDVAENVRGVKEVHNRLRLQKQGTESTTSSDGGRTTSQRETTSGSRENTRRTNMSS
jgi:hypothetical protein